jgi:hypothetical protein
MTTSDMKAACRAGSDPWLLEWCSPFQTHGYHPLYLANGVFGGLLDLSGATMDLWSSEIGCVPVEGRLPGDALAPVTALRTQVYFRNETLREQGFWMGASGIHCSDPRYTADPSMPHIAQVYDCRQQLDLRNGVATTQGKLALGSSASLWAAIEPERAIAFRTRVIFLKDSTAMGIEVEADADMLFVPEPVLQEAFGLKGRAKGVLRHGNAIDCMLAVQQTLLEQEATDFCIAYTLQPNGQPPYHVRVSSQGCRLETIAGQTGLATSGRAFFLVEILPHGRKCDSPMEAVAFANEQCKRWEKFWQTSAVCLPAEEALWQQRYHASLFYVAQSMGRGAVQPVGLSKPMLPYWFGCFHDTDTYFCRPLLETGHFAEAQRHLDYRFRGLEPACRIAREHQRNGALYPWQADSSGNGPAEEIPMNSAIIACEAWVQFLYGGTPEALHKAATIVTNIFANLCDLIDFSGDTVKLRPQELMTFSETITATDPTEIRIACRATAAALLAAAQHHPDAAAWAQRAQRILGDLDLPLAPSGAYAFSPAGNPAYLRCPSVTLGSFPLHHLVPDPQLQKTFDDELARTIFLFAWLPHQASVVASQLGRREGPTGAAALLRAADAFYKPYHACDEWENRRSVRAQYFVTAAGAFCTSIHHMLVAETASNVWSLFPATPPEWHNIAFRDLYLRCGWSVSARMEAGYTVEFSFKPTHKGAHPRVAFLLPNPSQPLRDHFPGRVGEPTNDHHLLIPALP